MRDVSMTRNQTLVLKAQPRVSEAKVQTTASQQRKMPKRCFITKLQLKIVSNTENK